jgi:hypothetical protein
MFLFASQPDLATFSASHPNADGGDVQGVPRTFFGGNRSSHELVPVACTNDL